MTLKQSQLIGLKIKTESGQFIGKVDDFELDIDNLKITKLIAVSGKILSKILAKELVIDSSQIIKITEKEVVVSDSLIKIGQTQEQAVSI